jgi:hypothetical protein
MKGGDLYIHTSHFTVAAGAVETLQTESDVNHLN